MADQDPTFDLAVDASLATPEVSLPETARLGEQPEDRASAISAQEIHAKAARVAARRAPDPNSNALEHRAAAAEEALKKLVIPPSDPGLSASEQAAEAQAREGGPPSNPGQGGGPPFDPGQGPPGRAVAAQAKGGGQPQQVQGDASATLMTASAAPVAAKAMLLSAPISYTTVQLTENSDTKTITDSGSFAVLGLGGNDVITVNASTTGSDLLNGGAGNDRLTAAGSDDILIGGPGADTIDGGAGNDTVDYSTSGAALIITLTTSTTSTATTRPSGGDATGDVLSNIENVTGTAFNDLISGNQFANQLVGGAGNDTIKGNAGADLLYGDGLDSDNPAGGADLLDGGADNDTIHGGGGNDTVIGGFGNDELYGDAGDDMITAGDGDDLLDGGDGNDQLLASLGNDTLRGGAGDDDLNASSGNDQLFGGDGNDALNGGDGDDQLSGEAGNDNLLGGAGTDVLSGGDGDDSLDGGDGADQLSGGAGNDTLVAGAGDAVDGGDGIDLVDFSTAAGPAGVDLGAGTGTGAAQGATFANIENLKGSSFNDILVGNNADNIFFGSAGADQMIGQGGLDTADYSESAAAISLHFTATLANPTAPAFGTGGDAEGDSLQLIERVIGSAFNDTMIGGELNDIFIGGAGADVLDGGGGSDTTDYSFSTVAMTVDLRNGTASDGDQLSNMENVVGSAFNDTLFGNAAVNRLEGGAGDDWLQGGAGGDRLIGGAGIDTADYSTSDGGVLIQLVDNADPNIITTGATNAGYATSHAAGDQISQIESLIGSAFNDDLRGSVIGNKLVSGAGNDILRGGSGADLLVANGINPAGGFKQLIGDGIGDGGTAGLDTYRIIGTGASPSQQLNLITNYQVGENIELNSLTGYGQGNLTLGSTTYRCVVFQSTVAGQAHDTRILVTTANDPNATAIANSILNGILANDADGPDLIVNAGLTADSPWIG